jgi:hypothetical protein
MRARQSVEFTDVDLVGGGEIATPVVKATVGLHIMQVEHELMCELRCELCMGEGSFRLERERLGRRYRLFFFCFEIFNWCSVAYLIVVWSILPKNKKNRAS